jgi:hypothetical protein
MLSMHDATTLLKVLHIHDVTPLKVRDHYKMQPVHLLQMQEHPSPTLHTALTSALEVSPAFDACVAFLEQGEHLEARV